MGGVVVICWLLWGDWVIDERMFLWSWLKLNDGVWGCGGNCCGGCGGV